MSLPRFPKYKDSGVEWLGKVPEHWRVSPLKRLASIDNSGCYGVEPQDGELSSPVATTAQIDSNGVFDVDRMPVRGFNRIEFERYGCKLGDILVVKSSGSATNIISGKAGIIDADTPPFVFSNFLMRIVPGTAEVRPKFLYLLLVSHLTRERIKMMVSTTTYPNIQVGEYVAAVLPVPPLEEQDTILGFLDDEIGKIDTLIEEQRRLIELLKEKRQVVISHAVTKGLNPDARMKDSCIGWLGVIPASWPVTKLMHFAVSIGDGLHGTPEYVDESEYYFINGNNLCDGSICYTDTARCVSLEEFEKHRVDLDDNSLLMSINGTIGNLGLYRGETVMLGKSAAYVKCCKQMSRDFLFYFLQSGQVKSYFDLEVTGTTISNLSLESIRNLPIVCPPIVEQREIVLFLSRRISEINRLVTEACHAIDLLQERRTALISAAVTGKIDVRGVFTEAVA